MKVYMTLDAKGNPRSFGNSRKFAWKSFRWIKYHIGPRRGEDSWFVRNGGQVKVIDLKNNIIESFSAKAFLIINGSQDTFKKECIEIIGFATDPQTLINMWRSNLLNPNISDKIESLLLKNSLI